MPGARRRRAFQCHAWLANERIAIGTSNSRILITAGSHVNQVIPVGPARNLQPNCSIMVIRSTMKGFIAAGQYGTVDMYDRSVDPNTKEDMYMSSLQGADVRFEVAMPAYHHGPVTGMDVCTRKPILVTTSSDRSIRIWNYATGECELCKHFPEEASSVAIHPSGLYVLVGFGDKLRLMNVLIDDFRLFKEFPIRSCRECCFSNGGHVFAAAHGNMIQLYSVWTFENYGNLKGHNGKVRSLHWTPDDAVLVSAGSDGAVYSWIVRDLKRDGESIHKNCSYTSAVCTPDGKSIYAVGSDRLLKEITESAISCQLDSTEVLTQLAISNSGRMMFAGTAKGALRSMKYPLTGEAEDFQQHQVHSAGVSRFRVSCDDTMLFSAGEDGTVYLFKVMDRSERGIKKERAGALFSDEILITKSDLEEKTVVMAELRRSLEELKLEHEYQLRLKDMNFNEKLKELTEKYSQEIEALKIGTSVLRAEKEKEEVKQEEQVQSMKTGHMNELHDIEARYNTELMEEYEKFQALQTKSGSMQEQWQRQMKEYDSMTQRSLAQSQKDAEERLAFKQTEISKLNELMAAQTAESTEIAAQNAQDIDHEITLLHGRYERRLRAERDEGARLKGENGIMRKKFNTLNKDIEDNRTEAVRMREDEKKLRAVITMLEKEIAGFKKEMGERDELIQDKERRVYELKKKNQELEKYKFVMDYQIKELKEQVEPRENEITVMTEQISSQTNPRTRNRITPHQTLFHKAGLRVQPRPSSHRQSNPESFPHLTRARCGLHPGPSAAAQKRARARGRILYWRRSRGDGRRVKERTGGGGCEGGVRAADRSAIGGDTGIAAYCGGEDGHVSDGWDIKYGG
ncbi:WD40-repeat-containing domain protein [Chytriomyces sp. MP71]|nr:WD40-repeat-containing domain protein [Chytriomyces sp. MP71]